MNERDIPSALTEGTLLQSPLHVGTISDVTGWLMKQPVVPLLHQTLTAIRDVVPLHENAGNCAGLVAVFISPIALKPHFVIPSWRVQKSALSVGLDIAAILNHLGLLSN